VSTCDVCGASLEWDDWGRDAWKEGRCGDPDCDLCREPSDRVRVRAQTGSSPGVGARRTPRFNQRVARRRAGLVLSESVEGVVAVKPVGNKTADHPNDDERQRTKRERTHHGDRHSDESHDQDLVVATVHPGTIAVALMLLASSSGTSGRDASDYLLRFRVSSRVGSAHEREGCPPFDASRARRRDAADRRARRAPSALDPRLAPRPRLVAGLVASRTSDGHCLGRLAALLTTPGRAPREACGPSRGPTAVASPPPWDGRPT
jgi:hypothetical protein